MKKIYIIIIFAFLISFCKNSCYLINSLDMKNNRISQNSEFPSVYIEHYNRISFNVQVKIPLNFKNIMNQYNAKSIIFNENKIYSILQKYNRNLISKEMVSLSKGQLIFYSQSNKVEELNNKFFEYSNNFNKDYEVQLKKSDMKSDIFKEFNIQKVHFNKYIDLNYKDRIKKKSDLNLYDGLGILGYQEIDGLKIFSSILDKNIIDYWTPFQIILSSEGIEKIQILYAYEFEKTENKILLVSFDEVIQAIKSEFDSILSDNQYEIDSAELMLWVDQLHNETIYNIYPIWVFNIKEFISTSKDKFIQYQKLINAETGKIMELN